MEKEIIFTTKSGVYLEFRGEAGLYTSNLEEVEKALIEDLNGSNPFNKKCAEEVIYLMTICEVVTEK